MSADGSTFVIRDLAEFRIYTRAPDGTLRHTALSAPVFGLGEGFDVAVALSADGDTLAVVGGTICEQGETASLNGTEAGSVYIFNRRDAEWRLRTCVGRDDPSHKGGYTNAVALSADGGTLAVGNINAIVHDAEGSEVDDVSSLSVFRKRASDGLWERDALLEPDESLPGAGFSTSIALNGDGTTLAVGAPFEVPKNWDIKRGYPFGAAYVFVRTEEGWSKQAHLVSIGRTHNDRYAFGFAVALDEAGDILRWWSARLRRANSE